MELKAKVQVVFKTSVGILLLAGIAACQSGLATYKGQTADADNRFALQAGGPNKGSWQTRDLLIEFQYWREQQDLQISGLVKPQDYLLHFDVLKNLFLNLHFVDAGGKVLVDEAIMSDGYRVAMPEKLAFKANLKIPPDSTAIAFSYRGEALFSDPDSIRDSGWQFWKGP